ncbi:glycine cleavage system protein GcvH [bacterium]|nr:glycine cleavage system protein GcvH [bacterium]
MDQILGYNMPLELYYHPEHTWVRQEENDVLVIGMTELYLQNAGDTTYIDLPEEDDEIEQGETAGKIQSSKWVGKLIAPVSGEVIEVNEDLEDDFMLLNQDPYGDGWIMKIKPSNWDDEKKELMFGTDDLNIFIEKEIDKLGNNDV